MEDFEISLRDQALAVLMEIAGNTDTDTYERGMAADALLVDLREHRHADINDRTQELQRSFEKMEHIAQELRQRLDEKA